MNKIFCLAMVSLVLLNTTNVFASQCLSRLDGFGFYGVIIKNNEIVCRYRYCDYNCTYSSYSINGQFIPSNGPWEKNDDGNDACYSLWSNSCSFDYA